MIIFEWQDFEESLKNRYNLPFPGEAVYYAYQFSLDNAIGNESISIFVDSKIINSELSTLAQNGLKRIFLRCAGFNMLDVDFAKSLGIKVFRVASYSPESIAEFALTLMLCLARKIPTQREKHRSNTNGRTISEMGFCLHNKVLGLHGFGKIAQQLAMIAKGGFNMDIRYFDPFVKDLPGSVATLKELYASCDIVSIHVPLNAETKDAVNEDLLSVTKPNFMLINTARGGIVETNAIVKKLQSSFYYGTDVWGDHDQFDSRLFVDNCIQTDHVAFFTDEAVRSILEQTLESFADKANPANVL